MEERKLSFLRKTLIEKGFVFSQPAHTLFCAKAPSVSLLLYLSGKCMISGKGAEKLLKELQERDLSLQQIRDETVFPSHIGSDESGKGDCFGPLVVAALYLPQKEIDRVREWGVRDGKQLNESQIFSLEEKLISHYSYSICTLLPAEYNARYAQVRNLNQLLATLHRQVLSQLYAQNPSCEYLFVDQFATGIDLHSWLPEQSKVHLIQKTGGERFPAVAAASILARAQFLRSLKQLSSQFGLSLPRGAVSAPIHSAGRQFLSDWGKERLAEVAKIHFRPVKEWF